MTADKDMAKDDMKSVILQHDTEQNASKTIRGKEKGASILEISENYEGQRIDNFLLTKFKGMPKSHVYKLLRKGEVRVNKKRTKPTYRLKIGDLVRIPPVREEMGSGSGKLSRPSSSAISCLKHSIIYEDESLLVLNKPAGMASHGGSGINFGVIEVLRAARPELSYLELVHRLDRGTSGCLLLAKKRSMLRQLHQLLREGNLSKKYWLLVKGQWTLGRRTVEESLLKNRLLSGERMVKVSAQGKPALTVFRPIQVFGDVSLLEAEIHTGKTHQIRVHAAHLGYPIAGDDKYGDKEFNKFMAANYGLKHIFLHARFLKFYLPNNGKPFEFTANLDEDSDLVLKIAKKHNP